MDTPEDSRASSEMTSGTSGRPPLRHEPPASLLSELSRVHFPPEPAGLCDSTLSTDSECVLRRRGGILCERSRRPNVGSKLMPGGTPKWREMLRRHSPSHLPLQFAAVTAAA